MNSTVFDARLQHPFSMVVYGPSQSGKSTFIFNLLRNASRLINVQYDYIVCFIGSNDTKYIELKAIYGNKIDFVRGLPKNLDVFIRSGLKGFLIFDDLMMEATSCAAVTELFTRRCHHENLSVALLLQDLFAKGKDRLTMLRSTHYLVVFQNPLDQVINYAIANRVSPANKKVVIKMMQYVQSKYRYLFLDGKQSSLPEAKFRTDLFNEHFQRCFIID
jgi:energy-coupling factor transporter ATP-binding protein EcfA2